MDDRVCWRQCNKRGGKCSYCDGYCCNGKAGTYPGWNGDCPAGAIAVAPLNGHRCVRYIKPSTTTSTSTSTTTFTTPSTEAIVSRRKLQFYKEFG